MNIHYKLYNWLKEAANLIFLQKIFEGILFITNAVYFLHLSDISLVACNKRVCSQVRKFLIHYSVKKMQKQKGSFSRKWSRKFSESVECKNRHFYFLNISDGKEKYHFKIKYYFKFLIVFLNFIFSADCL